MQETAVAVKRPPALRALRALFIVLLGYTVYKFVQGQYLARHDDAVPSVDSGA